MFVILFLSDSIFLRKVYARKAHNFKTQLWTQLGAEPDACALNAPNAVVCVALLLFLLLVICVLRSLAIYSTKYQWSIYVLLV